MAKATGRRPGGPPRRIRPSRWRFGEVIAAERLRRGLSHTDAAKAVGVSRPVYIQAETGSKPVTIRTVEKIAAAYGLNSHDLWLMTKTNEGIATTYAETLRPGQLTPLGDLVYDVPLHSVADSGGGLGMILSVESVEYAPRPIGISRQRKVFSFRMRGESMLPRFEPGDLIYCDPERDCEPGDYALVRLVGKDDPELDVCLVRRLVAADESSVTVEYFSPFRTAVTFPREHVRRLCRILTSNELLGIS